MTDRPRRLLVAGGTVFTADEASTVLPCASVLIEDGAITAVVEGSIDVPDAFVVDARGCVVLPGLINAHQHHWYGLFKGFGTGLLLEDWIEQVQVPLGRSLSREALLLAMELAAAEMLLSGTTTFFNHMVTKVDIETADELARISERLGLRQVFGLALRPESVASDLAMASALARRWQGSDFRRLALVVETTAHWAGLGASSSDLVRAAHQAAVALGLRISSHVAGGTMAWDRGYLGFVRQTGRTDIEALVRLGVLDPHWILAHAIWANDQDIAFLGASGAAVVYCPTSEATRGGGVAPVVPMRKAGVPVALGSDGPMVDMSVDLLEQAKAAMLFQNQRHLDPRALSPVDVLTMATRTGAQAVGVSTELGTLTPGNRADVAVFAPGVDPVEVVHRPIHHLVAQGRGRGARHVIVGGRLVVQNGQLLTIPPEELQRRARRAEELAQECLGEAGLLSS